MNLLHFILAPVKHWRVIVILNKPVVSLTVYTGSTIHRLVFKKETDTGLPPTMDKYLTLLEKTLNLCLLDYFDESPYNNLMYQHHQPAELNHLAFIKVRRSQWVKAAKKLRQSRLRPS
jgi:hypothetical protein